VSMRVVILTSLRDGFPALCIPRLVEEKGIELVAVIRSEGKPADRLGVLRRKAAKINRIGLLAAINARIFQRQVQEDIETELRSSTIKEVSNALSVPVLVTPVTNSDTTRRHLENASADLAVSLGNSWIAPSVFSIPRLGMINVHHELLPSYRGAQSVIWQLHNGSTETGYTIHSIERGIDTGRILHSETLDIDLRETLKETVAATTAKVQRASVEGLLHTLRNYQSLVSQSIEQGPGTTYSTPTLAQYRQMLREHRRLYELHTARR
jgi:methionyl-tRNA formyltransferase